MYATNQQINTMQTGISNNASTIAVVQTDVSNLKTNYTTMRSDVNTLQTQVETGFNVNINGAKVKTVNPDSNYINFKSGTNVTLTNDSNSVKVDVPANGTIASGDTGIVSGGSVFNEKWPTYDEGHAKASVIKIPIQVNGKTRGFVDISADASELEVLNAAKEVTVQLDLKGCFKSMTVPSSKLIMTKILRRADCSDNIA